MTAPSDVWYADWDFWAFVVAAIAIVLSQLPPVRLWLLGSRIEVEVPNRIGLSHKVGNPNLGIIISLRNTGGKDIRIKRMSISISRDGNFLTELPGQNFYEGYGQASPLILLMPFTLKPGETWLHSTNFLQMFDRATEKAYRETTSVLAAEIQALIDNNKIFNIEGIVRANDAVVAPLQALFRKMFIWLPGDYTAELKIETDDKRNAHKQKYRFTIYESESSQLESQAEDYNSGAGILFDQDKHGPISIPIEAILDGK